ncbi:MAG: hypothetical protein K8R01_00960 [Methanococcoides sp.]|nr:hypothetical protein [Methanococcoides sp.]MCD4822520.1 hypothetical protein [Methanococcoides sp.]
MALPDICPQDNEHRCKKEQCYLYHIDWRTGEENCSIGYRGTHTQSDPIGTTRDTYAEETRKRLGHSSEATIEMHTPEIFTIKKETIEEKREMVTHISEIIETIVMESKDTTVIESHVSDPKTEMADEATPSEEDTDKKDKLTKMMDLEEISEDYEKDFWK